MLVASTEVLSAFKVTTDALPEASASAVAAETSNVFLLEKPISSPFSLRIAKPTPPVPSIVMVVPEML